MSFNLELTGLCLAAFLVFCFFCFGDGEALRMRVLSQAAETFLTLGRCTNTERPFDDEGFDVSIYSFLGTYDALDEEDGS